MIIVVGVVLLAVLLAWIDPLVVVLVAVVGGIVWLRRSDADPVHWGPVPRRDRPAGPGPGERGVQRREAEHVTAGRAPGDLPWR